MQCYLILIHLYSPPKGLPDCLRALHHADQGERRVDLPVQRVEQGVGAEAEAGGCDQDRRQLLPPSYSSDTFESDERRHRATPLLCWLQAQGKLDSIVSLVVKPRSSMGGKL